VRTVRTVRTVGTVGTVGTVRSVRTVPALAGVVGGVGVVRMAGSRGRGHERRRVLVAGSRVAGVLRVVAYDGGAGAGRGLVCPGGVTGVVGHDCSSAADATRDSEISSRRQCSSSGSGKRAASR